MLTVRFYKNFTKRSNSTKQPGSSDLYDSFPSLLKSGCTVTSPTIEVAISTSDPAALGYNYAYISDFSRYYFVNEWTYNMGLWIADLTVDVLASFKTEIGATEKYVLRSSSDYDETIVDTFYPVRNAWSSVESDIPTPFSYANRSYIIGFISAPAGTINANSQGSITYYYATEAQVVQIIRYLMSHDFIGSNLVDTVVGLTEQAVKDFVDPLQYIASVTFFPFDARSSAILPSVKPQIGWYDTSNDSNIPSLVRIDSLTMQFSGNSYRVAIPENLYASGVKQYLAYAPYTRHAAHIEPFGTIPLDTDLMVGREYMYCCYDVDLVTGLCRLSIGTDDKRGDLAICTAAVGVPISLSQITTDVISGTLAAAGGIIGAVAAGSAPS